MSYFTYTHNLSVEDTKIQYQMSKIDRNKIALSQVLVWESWFSLTRKHHNNKTTTSKWLTFVYLTNFHYSLSTWTFFLHSMNELCSRNSKKYEHGSSIPNPMVPLPAVILFWHLVFSFVLESMVFLRVIVFHPPTLPPIGATRILQNLQKRVVH